MIPGRIRVARLSCVVATGRMSPMLLQGRYKLDLRHIEVSRLTNSVDTGSPAEGTMTDGSRVSAGVASKCLAHAGGVVGTSYVTLSELLISRSHQRSGDGYWLMVLPMDIRVSLTLNTWVVPTKCAHLGKAARCLKNSRTTSLGTASASRHRKHVDFISAILHYTTPCLCSQLILILHF